MSGLGLALAGVNAYYDQNRKLEQYDHDKALRDAELSNLDAKTASERSRYQLSDAQNQANASLLPQQTSNTRAQLGLTATDLAGQKARQPTELQTKNLNATAERDKALISKSIGEVDVADLPDTIRLHKQAGILKDAEAAQAAVGGLAKYVQANDSAGAASFINKMNDVAPEGKKLTGRVASVGFVNSVPGDKNSPRVLVGIGEDGKPVTRQDGSMMQVPEQLLKPKTDYQFMHDTHGNVYVGNKTTGGVNPPIKGDPTLAAARNGHLPSEVQTAEWLIKNKDNPEAIAAWNKVHSLKGGRKEFIENMLGKAIMPNDTEESLAKKSDAYGRLYDKMNEERGAGAPPAQLPGAPLDPRIGDLIGVPQ